MKNRGAGRFTARQKLETVELLARTCATGKDGERGGRFSLQYARASRLASQREVAHTHTHEDDDAWYTNTSSLKSRSGQKRVLPTVESSEKRAERRLSLAIIVPPWIVNPAERPSEIIITAHPGTW